MKKVIDGENGAISQTVNWRGGGSFIYAELKKWNEEYLVQIDAATSTEARWAIYETMKTEAFFRIDIDPEKGTKEAFAALPEDLQVYYLKKMLDKNHLYVNYTEIEDVTYKMSAEEQALNKLFYIQNR